jgi:hypothetical protein
MLLHHHANAAWRPTDLIVDCRRLGHLERSDVTSSIRLDFFGLGHSAATIRGSGTKSQSRPEHNTVPVELTMDFPRGVAGWRKIVPVFREHHGRSEIRA